MFCFEQKVNMLSRGKVGATINLQSMFLMEPCQDFIKVNTKDGKTRYAIQEKSFVDFNGYLADKSARTIKMVSGTV